MREHRGLDDLENKTGQEKGAKGMLKTRSRVSKRRMIVRKREERGNAWREGGNEVGKMKL